MNCDTFVFSRRDSPHSLGVSVGASGALPLWNRGGRSASVSPSAEEATQKMGSEIVDEKM